jgi:DNA-binding NarL/FixJ family response regulator
MILDEIKIRILTVDDHPLLREGIAAVLEHRNDMVLVGEAKNGREAVECFRASRPDVTLMDLQMPEMGGIQAIIEIRKEFPAARIIVLTTFDGDAQALRAFRAGAMGYLLKGMLRKELIETIHGVHMGQKRIPPQIAAALAAHVLDEQLTEREIQILCAVALGNSNKQIADEIGLAEATVKYHLSSILSKLHANDRTHAVTIAIKRGYIER